MSDIGYVKNWRKIVKWRYYKRPEYTHLWQHIIRRARFEDGYNTFGQLVKRGQTDTSLRQLSEETGVSVSTCNRILKALKTEQQIEHLKTRKNSIITILNYDEYNPMKHETEHEWNTDETLMEHSRNNYKKDKKDKKDKNKETPTAFSPPEKILKLIEYWNSRNIGTHNPTEKIVAKIIKALKKRKSYPEKEILEAIDNYAMIKNDSTYLWSHKWTLWEFLARENADRFYPDEFDIERMDKSKNANPSNEEITKMLNQKALF